MHMYVFVYFIFRHSISMGNHLHGLYTADHYSLNGNIGSCDTACIRGHVVNNGFFPSSTNAMANCESEKKKKPQTSTLLFSQHLHSNFSQCKYSWLPRTARSSSSIIPIRTSVRVSTLERSASCGKSTRLALG